MPDLTLPIEVLGTIIVHTDDVTPSTSFKLETKVKLGGEGESRIVRVSSDRSYDEVVNVGAPDIWARSEIKSAVLNWAQRLIIQIEKDEEFMRAAGEAVTLQRNKTLVKQRAMQRSARAQVAALTA